jgi:hypothetical protein
MRSKFPRPADLEIGDTADLEVCGTGLASIRFVFFDSRVSPVVNILGFKTVPNFRVIWCIL